MNTMATPRLIRAHSLLRNSQSSLAPPRLARIITGPTALSTLTRRNYARPSEDGHDVETTKSFKSQLYDSTAERMRRVREEQARQAKQNDMGTAPGGRALQVLFIIVFCSVGGYYVGTYAVLPQETSSTTQLSQTNPPQHDTKTSTLQAAWGEIRSIIGEENVSTSQGDCEAHAGSEWSSYTSPEMPFMVVRPGSTEEVSAIMKVCHARRIPVTPYSGGTSLEGHFAATRGGICIDFGRMDKILKLNKGDLDVIVQPAVGWESLNEELANDGLFFPPDPGPGAQIGGMVGTGCSGTNAYRYGTMKDWVLSLTVVMADGTILKTRQRPRKSSAGYDLTRMFIGSEGTLGLVTEATLKVTPRPQKTSVAVCAFGTIREAADCVFKVVGAGVPIAAIEILDDVQMKCINEAGMTSKAWKEAPTLFFKFAGTPASIKEHIGIVQKLAKGTGSKSFEFARNDEEADELWSARKEALWSVMGQRREGDKIWTTDVAVPMSRLPDIIEETKDDIQKSGLFGSIVGHVGDGNFHTILVYSDKEFKAADAVVHRMVKRAIEMEGTATGEHGVGLVKRDYLDHELGRTTVDAMRKMKLAFDPLCLLNCDKVVRSQMPKPGEVAPW
ncbi:FAD-binding domain-containing protein [Aulographum hederae CBS 113979]|uniref:D-lactate dehydrogenase (cytochrome) n=1 Tax=Aulographum hederae CBS 113979 TaxID=1176131 RepID=A0A6G1H5N0_9PEZI|nr:FAD-binding domain-containing protein [Aulographum hederae CBS 113979]